ncbi:hypothetical protein [Flavobacterium ovatum]|uniref:hypothetical protein n=1 Tax=Flavobacterium ovatum TaxID=1928857 RepID=UPI00344ED0B4
MSTTKQFQFLRKDIDLIEKEIIEISEMAAQVSEKFQGLANNIQNVSGIVGLIAGRKVGSATNLIGGAIGLFGDIHADMKRDEALAKLAPKKLELSRAKTEIITNFRDTLNNRNENLWELFLIEANRQYQINEQWMFVRDHGDNCDSAFYLYVMNFHMIQVCDYLIEHFKSWGWSNGKNDSTTAIEPDKSYILEYILKNVILNESSFIEAVSNDTYTGGVWLLSQHESLFAAYFQNVISEVDTPNDRNIKRVVNRQSFIALKKTIKELNVIQNNDNLTWLRENNIYSQAKNISKLKTLNLYFFMYFFIGSSSFILFQNSSLWQYDFLDIISKSFGFIMLGVFAALFLTVFARIVFWRSEDDDMDGDIWYYGIYLLFTVLTLGLMPIAFYRYKKKEDNYFNFIYGLNGVMNI